MLRGPTALNHPQNANERFLPNCASVYLRFLIAELASLTSRVVRIWQARVSRWAGTGMDRGRLKAQANDFVGS